MYHSKRQVIDSNQSDVFITDLNKSDQLLNQFMTQLTYFLEVSKLGFKFYFELIHFKVLYVLELSLKLVLDCY